MHSPPIQISVVYRLFLVSALIVAAILALAEIGQPFLAGASVGTGNVEKVSARHSISTYRWNLDDARLPLLSLPDHIRGAVDLSITYSMDQFQFPLFQSLYYNERVGKYILMVMPKGGGGRAEFIDLTSVKGRRQFEAKGNSRLRLEDRGHAKLLTTGEGTVYTFAPLGNGEFHCSQIRNGDGTIINLKYTDDASIATIVDISGRMISFGYEKARVSSITQTWGRPGSVKSQTWSIANDAIRARPAVQLKRQIWSTANDATRARSAVQLKRQTWSIANEATRARPAVQFIPTGAKMGKRMPVNALTPAYTPAMAASDRMLAAIFGGPGALAAAHSFEPAGLPSQYPLYRGDLMGDDGKLRRGHLSYAMHIYGSANGTGDTEIYVPSGFTSHSNAPTPTDAAVTFFYPRLGNLNNVTLAVFHVANFRLSYEGGRVRIGNTGGRGGSIACYRHAHLEFYRGDTGLPSSASRPRLRINPASVFETSSNIASRSRTTSTRSGY